jgi:hypothetical protein
MEVVMRSVTEPLAPPAAAEPAERPRWIVELNIGGYTIRRWAEKRRHLHGLRPPTLTC